MSVRGHGDGSIYRYGKRWAGQGFVTQTDGRRVRRTVYGTTRRDAERKLVELLDKEDAGHRSAPLDITVERYLREWLDQIVVHRVRANTLSAYRFQAERYLIPDLGTKRLRALSPRDLRLYVESLRKREVGLRTIGYVHATLRSALEDAVREELLDRNVAKLVKVPRPPRAEPQPLTVEEVRTLLQFHRTHRLRALLVAFALLGLRRSEALGLQWGDVALEEGFLEIRRGLHRVDGGLVTTATKTRRSRRTIPLPRLVVDVLREHQTHQEEERAALAERWPTSGHVFTTSIGTPIDPRNCTRLVQQACQNAGVRVVRLHDFRHGCISVLLGLGVPPRTAMEIAGHSTIEMTMNVYGHVSLDEKREALDKLGSLFEEES